MKKIGIFLTGTAGCGGVYTYNKLILEALMQLQEFYQIVVYYQGDMWLKKIKEYPTHNVKVHALHNSYLFKILLKLSRIFNFPIAIWRKLAKRFHPLTRKMIKERCEVWIFPNEDPRSFLIPVPAIATIHDLMHRYEPQFEEVGCSKQQKSRDFTFSNMCRWLQGILVDSAVGKQHVIEQYQCQEEKLHILPYVATYSNQVKYHTPLDFEKKYRLPEKYIFYPAQFWKHKNHIGLLKAIKSLKNKQPEIKLVLSGGIQNGHQDVLNYIRDNQLEDNVMILGLVEDAYVPELYRRARALIMPTFFGPTNIPPLEAFIFGCPVAVSRIYGMPEQLKEAALYFDPALPDEIAACIQKFWIDDVLCKEYIQKGYNLIKNWNMRHFTKKFEENLSKIVHK